MKIEEKILLIERAANLNELEEMRVGLLGKKGEITSALKSLGELPPEERKERGQVINLARKAIEDALDAKKNILTEQAEAAQLAAERVDVSLPVRAENNGAVHPVAHVMDEIATIFADMGFAVRNGPMVEDDEHNFGALNFTEFHPARQMHDTFYVRELGTESEESAEKYVLRTHTSPVQVRTMRGEEPPIRIIAPGSTFRCDSDQTHTPMFHQVEGLVIDKNVHMGHLKGCVAEFLRRFFGVEDLPVRFRPSYFPFTEPSAEVDIGCKRGKDSLTIGAGEDWLEVMGCGMVHTNVLKNCGLDPEQWQGFAFGMGVERLAMLKYNIPDLRTFFDSDVRWLKHYGFAASDVPGMYGEK